jgi:hypothetical protein
LFYLLFKLLEFCGAGQIETQAVRQGSFFPKRVKPAVNRDKPDLIDQAVRTQVLETFIKPAVCFALELPLGGVALFASDAELYRGHDHPIKILQVNTNFLGGFRFQRDSLIVFRRLKIFANKLDVQLIDVFLGVIGIEVLHPRRLIYQVDWGLLMVHVTIKVRLSLHLMLQLCLPSVSKLLKLRVARRRDALVAYRKEIFGAEVFALPKLLVLEATMPRFEDSLFIGSKLLRAN